MFFPKVLILFAAISSKLFLYESASETTSQLVALDYFLDKNTEDLIFVLLPKTFFKEDYPLIYDITLFTASHLSKPVAISRWTIP